MLRFNGEQVPDARSLIDQTKAARAQTVELVYSRDGQEATTNVTLRDDASQPVFGAGLGQRELTRSTWSAPIVGIATTAQFTWATLEGLGNLLANLATGLVLQLSPDQGTRETGSNNLQQVSESVAGPVGILGTIFPQAEKAGPTQLVFLTAIISLTLAVMNALPIPALDGGRWFVMTLFKLMRRKLTKEREEKIQTIGFLTLIGLIILVTIGDVTKLF